MPITILSSVPVAAALVAVLSSRALAQDQSQSFSQRPNANAELARVENKSLPPTIEALYEADAENPSTRGHRVEFAQKGTRLSAVWSTAEGPYARSSLDWDAATKAFRGTTVTKSRCVTDDPAAGHNHKFVDVVVREEIHRVSERVIRDRWTRPLKVDCANGSLEIFQWEASLWSVPVGR